jgi:hypothetical protein
LIEFGSLSPLFHLLANSCYFYDYIFVVNIACDAEASLNVSHLDSSSRNTAIALSIMLFIINIQAIILFLALIKQSFFIKFLSFNGVSLIFNLGGQFSTNQLFFFRRNLLCKF